MKAAIIALIICFSACMKLAGQADSVKYLELTEPQLRDLGFVINDKGIFFKSEIPLEDSLKIFISERGYQNTPDDQGTREVWSVDASDRKSHEERLKNKENPTYYDSLPPVKCDYYFVKIIEVNGGMICDVEPHRTVAIPIIVRQTKYNFKIRKDVIVFMKLSAGLRKKLNYVDNLDKYFVALTGD